MADKFMSREKMTNTLVEAMEELLGSWGGVKFKEPPDIDTKHIKYTQSYKMMASGSEKGYGAGSHIGVVHFFEDEFTMKKTKNPCGVLILYIQDQYMNKFFEAMGLSADDSGDESMTMDLCKEICNMLIGSLNTKVKEAGFEELHTLEAVLYKNAAPEGVDYPPGGNEYQEVVFYLWDGKPLTADFYTPLS